MSGVTKVIYKDVAIGAAEDAAISTTKQQSDPYVDAARLAEGVDTVRLWSLEHNYLTLNGNAKSIDLNPQAFLASELSGADGIYTTPPTIDVVFDNQYTSTGITLIFAPEPDDLVSEVEIQWLRSGSVLSTETFYPDDPSYFCENSVTAYDEIIISLKKTFLPKRRARLNEIAFGIIRTYGMDELRSVKLVQEIHPISAEVAINTLDWTLDSKENTNYLFQKKQPVDVKNNNNLLGVFYIDKAKRLSTNVYEISCIDAIGVLDESNYPATIFTASKNAKTIINEILNGDFTLDMDPSLENETVKGVIPACTRRQALQQVLFAIGAVADTSRVRTIKVYPLNTTTPTEIPEDRTILGASVETGALVTAVTVTAHDYVQRQPSDGESSVVIGGVTYTDVQTTQTIVNPAVAASDKTNTKEVTGATLVDSTRLAAVTQRVYDYYQLRNKEKLSFVLDSETVGDYVTAKTMWEEDVTGTLIKATLKLSNTIIANAEVQG